MRYEEDDRFEIISFAADVKWFIKALTGRRLKPEIKIYTIKSIFG